MDKTATLTKNTGNYLETIVDHEIILVGLDGGELLALEGTGRVIWELIDECEALPALIAKLHDHYADPPEDLPDQVDVFLQELVAAGLLTVGDGSHT